MKLRIQRAPVVGTRKVFGHGNTGPDSSQHIWGDFDEPVHEGEEVRRGIAVRFRDARVAAGLSLGDVARHYEVRVTEVSDLERGYADPVVDGLSTAQAWEALILEVRGGLPVGTADVNPRTGRSRHG